MVSKQKFKRNFTFFVDRKTDLKTETLLFMFRFLPSCIWCMQQCPMPGVILVIWNLSFNSANRILKNEKKKTQTISDHVFDFIREASSLPPCFSPSGNIKHICLRAQVTDMVGRAGCWKIDPEGDQDQSGHRLCRSKALPPPWSDPESQSQGGLQAQAAGTLCSHQFMF